MAKLSKRDIAKDFDLPDTNGNSNLIRDLCGRWVVVYFTPEVDSPESTVEAREFSDRLGDFAQLGADVLAISPVDAETQRTFRAENGIRTVLLIDEDHAVMDDYGVWDDGEGAIRSTILVDPDGLVERAWYGVDVDGHAEAVLEEMRSRGHRGPRDRRRRTVVALRLAAG